MKKYLLTLVTVTGLFFAAVGQATLIPVSAVIDQAQETFVGVPVPGAAGTMTGSLDTDTNLLTWNILYGGLSGPAFGMHFHGPAPPGVNAGVVVNIGAISGLGSPSVGATIISASDVANVLAGLWYINIHTAANPGGEIRGQVVLDPVIVPEPGTLALFGIGLLGMGLSRRRKKV